MNNLINEKEIINEAVEYNLRRYKFRYLTIMRHSEEPSKDPGRAVDKLYKALELLKPYMYYECYDRVQEEINNKSITRYKQLQNLKDETTKELERFGKSQTFIKNRMLDIEQDIKLYLK